MKAARPSAQVRTVFTGSFEDVAAAKAAALALADQKCDFLFQNADSAAVGVFAAAEERGIRAFGSNRDQNALSPAILASAVIDMPRAFVETARRVKKGASTARRSGTASLRGSSPSSGARRRGRRFRPPSSTKSRASRARSHPGRGGCPGGISERMTGAAATVPLA